MPESTPNRPCAVCSDPVDPDEAHWFHHTDCPNSGRAPMVQACSCDLVVHPDCCPEPECQGP